MNEIMIHKLCEDISGYDGFVLYGAGLLARKILGELKKTEYCPLYCVVTSLESNERKLDNIDVYDLNEKLQELKKRKIVIVVSVTQKYENEIYELLRKNNITDVVLASHYFWNILNKETFDAIYRDKDIDWYLIRIKEWYWKKYDKELNVSLYSKQEHTNNIVLVVENFAPRVLKMSKSLQEQGKNVIVLLHNTMKESCWRKFYPFLASNNIKHFFYNEFEELIFFLLKNRPKIIHIFSNQWKIYTAYIIVQLQNNLGKVVFENYDIANGFYTNFDEEMLQLERYCLENAHGVCYREYSLEYLIDILKFNIKGKTVRFFDFCSDEYTIDNKKSDNGELALCYAGGVVTEEESPDCPFGGFLGIAEECEKSRCHLHIYPSVWDEKRYEKYIAKSNQSLYFHFHKVLDYDKLVNELSQYDYGIIPTKDNVWEKEFSGYNTKYKYIYAATNKYFDYLDAGLPIIAGLPLKMVESLEKKGVLINWKNGQYDFEYLRKMKDKMKSNVMIVKEELRIGRHINKLLDFYESI